MVEGEEEEQHLDGWIVLREILKGHGYIADRVIEWQEIAIDGDGGTDIMI